MEEEVVMSGGPLGWLSRNKAVAAVIFVLVVALVTGALGLWESPVKVNGKSIPPSPSVERFARGQTNFDAQLIWDSLSDDFTESLADQGQQVSTIQDQLNSLKDSGVKYNGVTYVGGHRSSSGEAYYLYVFSRQNSVAAGDVESIPYVFVVDTSGKIERIE